MLSSLMVLGLIVAFFITAVVFFYFGFSQKVKKAVVQDIPPNTYDPPFIAEPSLKDMVALMPFSYLHLVEMVNLIDYIGMLQYEKLVWQLTEDQKRTHSDLQQRALERLNILELAAKQGEI